MKTIFPEDLKTLELSALQALHAEALAEFDSLYPSDPSQFASLAEDVTQDLALLTEGLERTGAELAARAEKEAALASMAEKRESFAKVTGTFVGETDEGADVDDDDELTAGGGSDSAPNFAANAAASEGDEGSAPAAPVAYATGDGLGVAIDAPLQSWTDVGRALDTRLERFNATPYANAARRGEVLKSTQNFARFTKSIPEDQKVGDGTVRSAVRNAIERARDESRLEGGSLIAAGGWGAPSQISYERFPKLSSRDGIATFPEIGVDRGGLQLPHGSTFASVYSAADWFSFTEENDIDGEYATESGVNVEGTKPIYRIPPTTWVDHRLHVDGIHVQAGILEQRGYPEGIAAELAQVLDAHAHYINAKVLAEAASGSTSITWTAAQVGAVAPVLTAVELQVLHYRDTHRMEFNTPLEAKFPNWLKGAFRADLARRQGVDLIDVSDARIDGWLRDRGIATEWVYDWQSLAGTSAASFLAAPQNVSFLLYAAGTWVKASEEVISLDTMYDSTLLGTNDYTVLFTEEAWFLAKAGPDSRLITVPINPTGVTGGGVEINRLGVKAA